MIVPQFECEQDEKKVVLLVRAPHSRPRDIDISVTGKELHFHCSPYLLHLRFPHALSLDPEDNPASYSIDTGIATIPLLKEEPGKYFERLDMLSTLLVGRKKPNSTTGLGPPPVPSIEVLSSENAAPAPSATVAGTEPVNTGHTSSQQALQNLLEPEVKAQSILLTAASENFRENVTDVAGVEVAMSQLSVGRPKYGFGARYEGIFEIRAEDMSDTIELPSPDSTPVWRRPQIRQELEDKKFDEEHFVADFMLSDEFRHVLEFKPVLNQEKTKLSGDVKDAIIKLPKREYLSDVADDACADLAGLLFAYCYDHRTTCGEGNVESPWTISRLCASFSCLEVMHSPVDAVRAAYRRSLAYPLYRNTDVADLVLADLRQLLDSNGNIDHLRSRLLRVLVSMRLSFEEDKLLRIFSDIFLTDFCVWIQSVDDSALEQLANDVRDISVDNTALGWDLVGLQNAALNMAMGSSGTSVPEVNSGAGHSQSMNGAAHGPEIVIRGPAEREGFEMTPVSSTYVDNGEASESDSSSESSSDDESSSSDEDVCQNKTAVENKASKTEILPAAKSNPDEPE